MKVVAATFKNLMGFDYYKIAPKMITRILGENGSGKTSLLTGFLAALQGGDLASVQRIDPNTGVASKDPAEVVLVLDDEFPTAAEAAAELPRGLFRVEREGADTTVFERVENTRGEKKTPRPSSFISGVYDRELSNPLNFLEGTPAKRLDWLLRVLPLTLTPVQVHEAVGDELWSLVEKEAAEGHPLHVLTAVRKKIFDARTGINVSKDDKEATYKQIEASIPAKMPEATKEGVAALERRRDEVADRVQKAKAAADHALKEKNTAARAVYDDAVNAALAESTRLASAKRADLDKAVADLRLELERLIADLTKEAQESIDAYAAARRAAEGRAQTVLATAQGDAENERQAAVAAIVADEQELSTLTGDLERARGQVETNTKLQTQIAMVEKFKGEHADLKGKAERYTAGLEAVDALKGRLLAALPFPGLEIDGKDILINKVPLDSINTAAQIAFAVKVAALRAKERVLPVLFVDGAEALDAKNLAALEAAILAEGCQAFIAIRTEGPLTVETA